tara:strand:+ start:777 stop:1040 length:264 start_codon:yes stop_codon:yes gene_type:complete
MKKTEDKIKAMITEEQLKTVNEQQNELSNHLRNVGVLEVQKANVLGQIEEVSKKIETTKKELEDEYGQINIDLKDGSYTEIEKEDAE